MQNGVRLLLPSKTAEFLKYGKFSTLMASLVKHKAEATLPTVYGKFRIHVFEDGRKKEHTALVKGKLSRGKPALARIHSQCLTGDTLGSTKCDCGLQLRAALGMIGKHGGGPVYPPPARREKNQAAHQQSPQDRGAAGRGHRGCREGAAHPARVQAEQGLHEGQAAEARAPARGMNK